MFYLTTHSTHFIYGYMVSDIWLRTILIVRKETRCRHIGYSYRLTARVLLYAPSHRQDNTYHGLCYTSCGALAGTRNSSMGPRLTFKATFSYTNIFIKMQILFERFSEKCSDFSNHFLHMNNTGECNYKIFNEIPFSFYHVYVLSEIIFYWHEL